MATRTKILEACVRSRLLYSVQAWELSAVELRKIESIMHNFLRKMVSRGFKRKNVPLEYLKQKRSKSKPMVEVLKPEDLDWAFVYTNQDLERITKTSISTFCKIQHLKYIVHMTRLSNDSLQKQILFSCDHKRYARDRWLKFEKQLNISKDQFVRTMQHKQEFLSLLKHSIHRDTFKWLFNKPNKEF